MYAKLAQINGSRVVLDLDGEIDVNQLKRFSDGKQPTVELIVADGRRITPDQRKKIFAMFGDMSDYLGYFPREVEEIMKYQFIQTMDRPEWFSMADCSESLANEFLTFIIDFCIKNDIPFKTKVIDIIQNDYGLVHDCVLKRICVVCGKPHADIHHVDTVGRGFDRRKINHIGRRVLPLCRTCHQRFHEMGSISFFQQNQILPIKLTADDIKKLGLESNERVDEYAKHGDFKKFQRNS
ncbi:putative HNHc nuclease (plasmid) [Fructilactobacillus ixorae]|uniref:HNHc nuclease n=1 Tax=Fructilactobacillus ixorae TaxID=1750535 RepID=A0ABY5C5E2_9LACO|nr:putative HNHc nuclease [Fructilactobacillus ixorae]USS93984.1 putative HNHc nuclease [Fructilactobacillus ixorae]